MHIDAAGGRLALSGAQGVPLREDSQQCLAECLTLASEGSAAAAAVAAGAGAEARPPYPIDTASRAALLERLAPQLMRCTTELVAAADHHLPSFGNAQAAGRCRATVVAGLGCDAGGFGTAGAVAGGHWVNIICDAAVRAAATEDGLSATGDSPGMVLLAQASAADIPASGTAPRARAQVVGSGNPAWTSNVQRLQACCLAGLSRKETVRSVAETDAPTAAAEAAALPLPAYSLGAAARVRVMRQLARLYLAAAEARSARSIAGSDDSASPVRGGRATVSGGGKAASPVGDALGEHALEERCLWELLEGALQAQRLWGEETCVWGV